MSDQSVGTEPFDWDEPNYSVHSKRTLHHSNQTNRFRQEKYCAQPELQTDKASMYWMKLEDLYNSL